jgi:hypothetical protein
MRRPAGITILSLLLGWLAVAGTLNAWFIFSGDVPDLGPIFGTAALIYAACAFLACLALWKMKPWALAALNIWMAVCLFIFAGFAARFEHFIVGGIPGLVGFGVFIGLLFLGIHTYVKTRIEGPEQPPRHFD